MSATQGTSVDQADLASLAQAAPQNGATAPQRELAEEVRVAMALNGGVSLAVWMGGCAVELDAARRAHLGEEDLGTGSEDEEPGSRRTIYHALCTAFERELVIDLMSGSSAGGINGALLAAAIDGRRRLHPDYLRDKWVQLGEFETLLHPLRTPSPTSLMAGREFFVKLRTAFEELLPTQKVVDERRKDPQRLEQWIRTKALLDLPAEQAARSEELSRTVKLDVTATDVIGEEQHFRDTWGEDLVAIEYRRRFQFRRSADYTAQELAMAARASASFPLAFEPWAAQSELLRVDGRRWLIDGGLLDNAPIRAVLDLIPARASTRRVRRYLCYLNADPPLKPTFDLRAQLEDANNPAKDPVPTRKPEPGATTARRPQLPDVVGYMVGLPRKATFVDQLTSIQRAVNRSNTVDSAEAGLLRLDPSCLRTMAQTVLPAYRSRRRLAALEELLDQPADVAVVARRLSRPGRVELPWIPTRLGAPKRWGWGATAAARVLYLLLDLIRDQLDAPQDAATRQALKDAREDIYHGLAVLDETHTALVGDPKVRMLVQSLVECDEQAIDARLCALACLMQERDPGIRDVVTCAARTAYRVRKHMPHHKALFGNGGRTELGDAELATFLDRTLSIEVVRRAYTADEKVDTEQRLDFAQLTPCAPALIFARSPLTDPDVPNRPDHKLTGTRWAHFAAFYRASWRANDFMWGRLDASVRVVDMLLSPEEPSRFDDGGKTHAATVAGTIADALIPPEAFDVDGDQTERVWLVAETLADIEELPDDEPAQTEPDWRRRRCDELAAFDCEDLLPLLMNCIVDDLTTGVDGRPQRAVTRALCIRAAQWEIVRRELPQVVATSKADRNLGTAVRPLDPVPPKDKDWRAAIEELRSAKPLPERLGVDDKGEQASALMIRTAAHGALIGFSALRETGLPGSPAFVLPRALLLPIAGMVTRRWWPYPGAVALVFWAFALVLAGRLITLDPAVASVWDWHRWLAVLTTWLAAAGAVMVCLVPFWRVWRTRSWWVRAREGAWLLGLLIAGGALGVVLVLLQDDVTLAHVVGQRGSTLPLEPVAGFALAMALTFRFLPTWVPARARKLLVWAQRRAWAGRVSLGLFLGPWVVLGAAFLFETVLPAARDGEAWSADWVTGWVALVLPGVIAFLYALFAVQRRGGWVRDKLLGL